MSDRAATVGAGWLGACSHAEHATPHLRMASPACDRERENGASIAPGTSAIRAGAGRVLDLAALGHRPTCGSPMLSDIQVRRRLSFITLPRRFALALSYCSTTARRNGVVDMATQQRIVVPFAGHRIGEGVSANTLERVGTGVVAESEGEDALAGGQTAEFKFRMVTSQSSLEEELKIGVGVDARYGLFSGSARFDFAKSSSVDSKSTYILATCTVKNALRAGANFQPTDAAKQLIDAADKDGFHGAFGTRFVQALRTGGELLVLVRITSSKVEHQSRIAAKLHAAYQGLAASADFKASFDLAKSDTSSHTEVDITSAQVGGQGLDIQFVGADADKIREQMNVFAQAVHQNPVAYEAELLSYDALALPFPSEDELEDKRDILEDCLVQKQRYWSILADLRLAQSNTANQLFSGSAAPGGADLADRPLFLAAQRADGPCPEGRQRSDRTGAVRRPGRAGAALPETTQLDQLRRVVDTTRRSDAARGRTLHRALRRPGGRPESVGLDPRRHS